VVSKNHLFINGRKKGLGSIKKSNMTATSWPCKRENIRPIERRWSHFLALSRTPVYTVRPQIWG